MLYVEDEGNKLNERIIKKIYFLPGYKGRWGLDVCKSQMNVGKITMQRLVENIFKVLSPHLCHVETIHLTWRNEMKFNYTIINFRHFVKFIVSINLYFLQPAKFLSVFGRVQISSKKTSSCNKILWNRGKEFCKWCLKIDEIVPISLEFSFAPNFPLHHQFFAASGSIVEISHIFLFHQSRKLPFSPSPSSVSSYVSTHSIEKLYEKLKQKIESTPRVNVSNWNKLNHECSNFEHKFCLNELKLNDFVSHPPSHSR